MRLNNLKVFIPYNPILENADFELLLVLDKDNKPIGRIIVYIDVIRHVIILYLQISGMKRSMIFWYMKKRAFVLDFLIST